MRIAVDARELCHRPTGVGRYLAELLSEWATDAAAAQHEWTLFAHQPPRLGPDWSGRVHLVPGGGGTAWEQWDFARALRADRHDVLFAPGYTAPLASPSPIVLTIHDVSYFAHPEWFAPREGARRRALTKASAWRARALITDSAFSRGEIARHLGRAPGAITVIPLGMRKPSGSYPLVRDPVVLYVGSIFERRRVDWLIEAFDLVAARLPGARLEVVGENRTARPRMDLEGLRARMTHGDRISIRSYVDESVLRDLYSRASAFAFLSEYEGFGLTPLEALAAGVPPVVLDTAVAREVCGDAARYVSPAAGPQAVAEALTECLTSDRARLGILNAGPAVLARYDWRATAAATLRVIEGAGSGR